MCRRSKGCTELGEDPGSWNRACPLETPEWFESQLDLFQQALSALAIDDRPACISHLNAIRSREMREWCSEHGQMSGMHRKNRLTLPNPVAIDKTLRDPLRSPRKYQRQVYERDGYRCRYCGIRLVENEVLSQFAHRLDGPEFRKGPTNLDKHGIIHAFTPVADHVVPWSQGGKTNPSNLVTSCGPCNYGKSGYTIDQIGLDDPLSRPPTTGGWDGLRSLLEGFK